MKLYLDTCVWLRLLKEDALDKERDKLQQLVGNRQIEIVLGFEILEEIIDEKLFDADRFETYARFIGVCTQNLVLFPFNVRMAHELLGLSWVGANVPVLGSDGVYGLLVKLSLSETQDVRNHVRNSKNEFRRSSLASYSSLWNTVPQKFSEAEVNSFLLKNPKELREECKEYIKGLLNQRAEEITAETAPTTYGFTMFEVARQRVVLDPKTPSKLKKISSTVFDQQIFANAHGTHCDFLVTDDKLLTEIASRALPALDSATRVMDFDRLVEILCS